MKPYIPDKLPIKNLNYEKIIGLVGRANAELARYDGLLQAIINPEILLSPLTTNEAVLSSKIEGTRVTLFEILHPFSDGNGRIGRLLIPLFLFYKNILSRPMFYLSSYLEKHRDEYYLRLREISENGNWDSWVIFYLNAVIKQSKKNSTKVKDIIKLYFEIRDHIVERTRSQYAHQLLDAIFDKPIFRSIDIQKRSKIPKQSLMPMLKQLQEDKIITNIRQARGRMPAVLVLQKLLEISEDKQFQF